MDLHYDIIVIGGGQAGLAMGFELARLGFDFVILDAGQRTGDTWRNRWDSLTLFTPARYSSLPGLRFPAEPDHMPHKDEVGDYLELYAQHFELPIHYEQRVVRLQHVSEWCGFTIETTRAVYHADQVVVATGPFQKPVVPAIAKALSKDVLQLHSSQYRGPASLPQGDVLVVGGGNSGVQIAAEVARTRRTSLSIRQQLNALPDRFLNRSLFWWLDTFGAMSVSVETRLGRRASQREFLIGAGAQESAQTNNIRLVSHAADVESNVVITSDGASIEAATVIWATGYTQDFSWIDAPVLNAAGRPKHRRGVTAATGLYFLGLPWQHTRGSALIGWVGRDAVFLARRISHA